MNKVLQCEHNCQLLCQTACRKHWQLLARFGLFNLQLSFCLQAQRHTPSQRTFVDRNCPCLHLMCRLSGVLFHKGPCTRMAHCRGLGVRWVKKRTWCTVSQSSQYSEDVEYSESDLTVSQSTVSQEEDLVCSESEFTVQWGLGVQWVRVQLVKKRTWCTVSQEDAVLCQLFYDVAYTRK